MNSVYLARMQENDRIVVGQPGACRGFVMDGLPHWLLVVQAALEIVLARDRDRPVQANPSHGNEIPRRQAGPAIRAMPGRICLEKEAAILP